MLRVPEKHEYGRLFKTYVSDAMFRILPGEHDALKAHAIANGCADARKLRRRYFKLLGMYSCPEPRVIINGLLDVYFFFKDLPHPNGSSGGCLTADAEHILMKEIKCVSRASCLACFSLASRARPVTRASHLSTFRYVQLGLLSDMPGVKMYVDVGSFTRGVRRRIRCLRGTSGLEGMHLHFRIAQHPGARACGPVLANARSNLFDYVWNIKALVRAKLIPDIGHFWPWINDLCVRALDGMPERDAAIPPVLRRWVLTDTTREPVTEFGIQWAEVLVALDGGTAQPRSALRVRADVDAVLATAEVMSAVVRGDAAAVQQLSGVVTDSGSLETLRERTIEKALAYQKLRARGLETLESSLRTTAPNAPREPMQLAPLASRDATGPLPVLAAAVHSRPNDAGVVVSPAADADDAGAAGASAAVAGDAGDDDAEAAAMVCTLRDDGGESDGAAPHRRAPKGSDEALANRATHEAEGAARMREKRQRDRAAAAAKKAARRGAHAALKRKAAAADSQESSQEACDSEDMSDVDGT